VPPWVRCSYPRRQLVEKLVNVHRAHPEFLSEASGQLEVNERELTQRADRARCHAYAFYMAEAREDRCARTSAGGTDDCGAEDARNALARRIETGGIRNFDWYPVTGPRGE